MSAQIQITENPGIGVRNQVLRYRVAWQAPDFDNFVELQLYDYSDLISPRASVRVDRSAGDHEEYIDIAVPSDFPTNEANLAVARLWRNRRFAPDEHIDATAAWLVITDNVLSVTTVSPQARVGEEATASFWWACEFRHKINISIYEPPAFTNAPTNFNLPVKDPGIYTIEQIVPIHRQQKAGQSLLYVNLFKVKLWQPDELLLREGQDIEILPAPGGPQPGGGIPKELLLAVVISVALVATAASAKKRSS